MVLIFLNKLMGKIEILLIDFWKKTTFWDILKWNRRPTIWERGSNIVSPPVFSTLILDWKELLTR